MAILSLELPNIHGFLESFERGPQLQLSCRQPCNWVIVGLCFSGQKRNFRLVKQLSKVVEPTQRPLMGDSAGAYNVGIWAQSRRTAFGHRALTSGPVVSYLDSSGFKQQPDIFSCQ